MTIKHSKASSCSCDLSFCGQTLQPLSSLATSHPKCTSRTGTLDQNIGTVSFHSFTMYPTSGAFYPVRSPLPYILTRWTVSSSKAALYPSYITSPSSISRYYADPVLASVAGHGLLADMLIAYIQSQVCVAWSAAVGSGAALPVYYMLGAQAGTSPKDASGLFGGLRKGAVIAAEDLDAPRPRPPVGRPPGLQVPISRISSRPSDLSMPHHEEIAPMCVSANDLVNPLPPSLFYGSGWHTHHPPPTGVPATDSTSHYWYSTAPTSRLRVPLVVGAGDIGIYHVREPRAVLGLEGSSAVECWVDDNYDGRVVIDNEGDSDEEEAAWVFLFFSFAFFLGC